MKRNILCTLAVMAACAILVACGKTDDQISPITPESNAASSEAEATPEPTPTLPPYEANVLTGEAKGENYPEGQRITALMVNNLVDARPQRGLSKAQMLFEIKVKAASPALCRCSMITTILMRLAPSVPAVTSSSS